MATSPVATLTAALSGLAIGYLWGSGRIFSLSAIFRWLAEHRQSSAKRASEDFVSLRPSSQLVRRQVQTLLEKAFRVTKSDLEIICDAFIKELATGLIVSRHDLPSDATEQQRQDASTLPMLPSYVDRLPSGDESGVFLAVDFGGTHVRIIKVIADDSGTPDKQSQSNSVPSKLRLIQSKFIIPDDLKHGSGYVLFDYIADGISNFLKQHPIFSSTNSRHATMPHHSRTKTGSPNAHQKTPSISEDPAFVPLGFTFSFPVQQTALDKGTILRWNKDFKCDDVLGKDPVKLLQASLQKKGITQVKVVALVNDTVGTLVAHAYEHPQAMVGLILGTGTNACYIEQYDRISKMRDESNLLTPRNLILGF